MKITFDSLFVDSDNYGVIVLHIVLWLVFALIRIPLYQPGMITKHFESGTNKKIEEYAKMGQGEIALNAFYNSALVQSAWGALDLIAVSPLAKMLNLIQIVLSFFITAGTINLIMKQGVVRRQLQR